MEPERRCTGTEGDTVLGGYLILGALFGLLAYREARSFREKNGVAPWRMDPVAWGVIVFVSGLLIGGILLLIARRTTKPAVDPGSVWAPPAAPAEATPAAEGSVGRNILPGA